MSLYSRHFSTRITPQSEPVFGKPTVPNSAGGHVFAVDKWKRLERFLILGCESGTYYASERKLTVENAGCVRDCLAEDASRTVKTIVEVSASGRAPKNDPAIFALALAAGSGHIRSAEEALPKVCRTGTHLFQFAQAVESFRGWGRGLRRAVAAWYESKSVPDLAYQVAKYRQRDGVSHRDLLRLAHPKSNDPGRQALYRWVVGTSLEAREVKRGDVVHTYPSVAESLPDFLAVVNKAQVATKAELIKLILDHDLPRECVPTEFLNDPEVWEALLVKMPPTATIRNLGKMTAVGLLAPLSAASLTVCDRLIDPDYLRKGRVHPLAIMLAASVYSSGRGLRGSLSWEPVSRINDALDQAFYAAFAHVEPANKRTLIGLDVSGSMGGSLIAGTNISAREAAAAMCLVTAKTEPNYAIMAFSGMLVPFDVSACSRVCDVVEKAKHIPFGNTDCALPMLWAHEKDISVDTFVVFTDSETWCGRIHPFQALIRYRERTGIPAKLVVVGMTATEFTIADPSDAGSLDVVGFDASAPAVIADFSRDGI